MAIQGRYTHAELRTAVNENAAILIGKQIPQDNGCIFLKTNQQASDTKALRVSFTNRNGEQGFMPVRYVYLYAVFGKQVKVTEEVSVTCGNRDCVSTKCIIVKPARKPKNGKNKKQTPATPAEPKTPLTQDERIERIEDMMMQLLARQSVV